MSLYTYQGHRGVENGLRDVQDQLSRDAVTLHPFSTEFVSIPAADTPVRIYPLPFVPCGEWTVTQVGLLLPAGLERGSSSYWTIRPYLLTAARAETPIGDEFSTASRKVVAGTILKWNTDRLLAEEGGIVFVFRAEGTYVPDIGRGSAFAVVRKGL